MIIRFRYATDEVSEFEVSGSEEQLYLAEFGITAEDKPEVLDVADWEELRDRRHRRPHKYTGAPIPLDGAEYEGEWFTDRRAEENIANIELTADLERAMVTLTELQRFCFAEVCMNGRTHRDVANELGKDRRVVSQAIEGAQKKLRNIF
ncbi:MAG: hypothetical protein LBN02_06140 [Oscillospiraceae bacterium]|jgi:DNA-directed RNA polymerase specialized sigma24 family protein|nr:hypothetical protein [Oscillospiraceae bacterium]